MKASRLLAYGDTSQITIEEIAQPAPGADQVLVKVAASSLNHLETFLRQGYMAQMMPLDLPATLGSDLAGEVVEVGSGVTSFAKGDRVIGRLPINGKGSHAEYTVAAETQLAKLPANVSFEAGATLPLVGLTGRQAVDKVGAKKGDRVLVTGALGSVGRVAVQYLQELGIEVVGAVLPAQLDEAKAMGLEAITLDDGAQPQFNKTVETVGGPVAGMAIAATKDGGTVIGTAGFPDGANADGRVKAEGMLHGDDAAMLQAIADAAGHGELSLPIAATFPLAELGAAYEQLANRPNGKIVIRT